MVKELPEDDLALGWLQDYYEGAKDHESRLWNSWLPKPNQI